MPAVARASEATVLDTAARRLRAADAQKSATRRAFRCCTKAKGRVREAAPGTVPSRWPYPRIAPRHANRCIGLGRRSWQANSKRCRGPIRTLFGRKTCNENPAFRFAQETNTANLSDSPRPACPQYLPLDGRRAPQPVVSWRSINPRNG